MMHDEAYGKAELQWSRRRTSTETRPARSERFLRGPHVGRESPSADELRHAFRVEEMRTQRRSDGTVSIEGVRFEVPGRYRHMERLSVRYASWDLGRVHNSLTQDEKDEKESQWIEQENAKTPQ